MNQRKKKMAAQIGEFMRQYQRKAQRGVEPNDRQYRAFSGKLWPFGQMEEEAVFLSLGFVVAQSQL